MDGEGYLKDAELFHRAIAIASDPDTYAKFFYDKGKADMTDGFEKDSKNIDLVRSTNQSTPKTGSKVRALDNDHGNRLSFKKR